MGKLRSLLQMIIAAAVIAPLLACEPRRDSAPGLDAYRAVPNSTASGAIDAASRPDVVKRAAEIRRAIDRNRVWGGHATIIPSRVITSDTIEAVKPMLRPDDVEPLIDLLVDEDGGVRSAALKMLAGLTVYAKAPIEARLTRNLNPSHRYEFGEALRQLAVHPEYGQAK